MVTNRLGELLSELPSCLGNLTRALRSLSLRFNLLNSTIPSTLWGLTDILNLDLSSNSLIGPLSDRIGNLKVVQAIYLTNNRLSCSIPSTIGGLQALDFLSLANNGFEGQIPISFGDSLSLARLDLSNNYLSGIIPKSLEALSYLQYLNLSFNRLQGEIPTGGTFQNLSDQSFLSNGGLCGAPRFHVPPCKRKGERFILLRLKYIIPGIMSVLVILVSLVLILIICRKRKVEAASETTLLPHLQETNFLPQLQWRRVSYQELLSATKRFNECNLLGTGAFGTVYRGTLSDGINVAIKVFKLELERAFKSFELECEVLSNICHRNLIRVISCCSQIDFKAIVLNYMPNGSLEKWLYSPNFSLNILQRLNIMIDVASAVQYLHHGYETPIVHCDLKPSNILLDDDMVAYVSDFGIAKVLGGEDSMTQTLTLATIGYMAPEYGLEGIVTRRGDVYSFGILLLETFTNRKPTDEMFDGEMSLKQWVENALLADAIVEVVDTSLLGIEEDHAFVSKRECLSAIMRLALACCAESPEERINMHISLATLDKVKIKFLMDATGGVVMNHRLVRRGDTVTKTMTLATTGYIAPAQTNLTTDQSALLALKANVTSDPQDLLSNWSTNTSACNWVGVTCGHVHLRVAALNLSYFGLTGRIPPELGNLSFLVVLRLRNNSFNGTLPVELAGLRRLKLVNFKYNNFMGEIPSWFGSLSSLKALNLYGNRFTGSIPAAIFNLSALQVFDLRNNQLSGMHQQAVSYLQVVLVIIYRACLIMFIFFTFFKAVITD
ncbi:putative protein kinase RLK-Pelle-LRR-XII-1 family [Rosa chinensis]|uniref:non-specific serine/threonine protein kinase n=1 Tax=Rosa chinensis TaxID=74649 RepID=A0A2P6Q4U9_ROSCH|nr:putative protein kinase RLK-Pelle-LRR-XII-1 family [Rosa chinensis]